MMITNSHFTANLPASQKINYLKMLERLEGSIEAILILELTAGNRILEVRSASEEVNDLTILLQNVYHQDHANDQLDKLITTDAHDHGVYYITKEKPKQTIIAPYHQ
jgi:hypothetical protein